MPRDLPKAYDPAAVEDRSAASGSTATSGPASCRQSPSAPIFTMLLPPHNVTGRFTWAHAGTHRMDIALAGTACVGHGSVDPGHRSCRHSRPVDGRAPARRGAKTRRQVGRKLLSSASRDGSSVTATPSSTRCRGWAAAWTGRAPTSPWIAPVLRPCAKPLSGFKRGARLSRGLHCRLVPALPDPHLRPGSGPRGTARRAVRKSLRRRGETVLSPWRRLARKPCSVDVAVAVRPEDDAIPTCTERSSACR